MTGFLDSIGLGGIGSFITDNKDWIKPIVSTGLGALQQNNTDNSQSQYVDYLKQREQQNYQDSVAAINAYNEQLAASGGGGGSGGGDGGAAARATEKNRQKAAKKANKFTQKTYKELLAMYAPYKNTADRLLPQMTKTYEDSLGLQKNLLDFVSRPDQQAKLNGSVPAYQVNVPLPDSVRIK